MTFSVARHLIEQQVAQRLGKDFAYFRIDLIQQLLQLLVALHRPLLVIHYPPDQ